MSLSLTSVCVPWPRFPRGHGHEEAPVRDPAQATLVLPGHGPFIYTLAQPSLLKHNSGAGVALGVPHGSPLGEGYQGP